MNCKKVFSPIILQELFDYSVKFHNALIEKSGLKESIIVTILCTTNNEERQIIRDNYKNIYRYPIQNDINEKIATNSPLHDIALNMFDTPYEYDSRELKKALTKKDGVDEDIIIEIFSSRPKKYLEIVDSAYNNFFKISLKEEIQKALSKDFSNYIITIMEHERPLEQTISKNEAYEIVKDINKIGINLYLSDVNKFKNLLVEKSRNDLILISRTYYQINKRCLYDDILEEKTDEKNPEDDMKEKNKRNILLKLIKSLIFVVITPAQFFAKKCNNALINFDINTLSRILISRAEIDIKAIRDYYFKEVKRNLKKDIKSNDNFKNNANIGKILISILK